VLSNYIPSKILAELAGCAINRVIWASFGDNPDSWFFAYQSKGGQIAVRLGPGAPRPLFDYIEHISSTSKELLGPIRVQLGSDGSFIVWSKSAWACRNVPETLRFRLSRLSSGTRTHNGMTMGSLKASTILNVAWHKDGSCFLRTLDNHVGWVYRTNTIRAAWDKIWAEVGVPGPGLDEMAELCYVAIDPHAPTSDTFAFIKKQKVGEEVPFILRFGQEPVQTRLSRPDLRIQMVPKLNNGYFRWAVSTRSGRPHQDDWDLELKKGQRVRVLRDMGKGWYVVAGKKDTKGWVHASWLDFSDSRFHEDPRTAWDRFSADVNKMMRSPPVKDFLSMADYVDTCTSDGCMVGKGEDSGLGICAHDLQVLLSGCGNYSLSFVKTWRNQFHPDRFAQSCAPEHTERLKAKAEQLFVLHGVVMEMMA